MVCAALAAMCALVVPATSGAASLSPAGHSFEIKGGGRLATSLGECPINSIASTVGGSQYATFTVGTCTSGTSATFSGNWSIQASGNADTVIFGGGPLTMKFASLPGCQLTSSNPVLSGVWSNSINTNVKSYYHADSGVILTWQNEGGSCALAGQQELVSYTDRTTSGTVRTPVVHPIFDLTNGGTIYWNSTP
jgi:hypothetical protein